ncbi:MAG TPA: NTP transferase domain-containing protein [bacterium]
MVSRKKKVAAIIQARMASTRLPGKVLQDVCGQPLLGWIIQRLQKCGTLDVIAVATTVDASDDLISQYCEARKLPCFRGPMDDVLARYLFTAEQLAATHIVRITGDVPFVDAAMSDRLVKAMLDSDADLARCSRPVVHEGIDPCSVSLLQRIATATAEPRYREHPLAYAWDHPGFAKIATIEPHPFESREGYHLSIDNLADLEFARRVYAHFVKIDSLQNYFSACDVLTFLDAHPQVRAINQKVRSNQGRVAAGAPTPRVGILLDGGEQRGFGHLVRMKQLAKELNSYFNCAVYFIAPDNQVCHQQLHRLGAPVLFLRANEGSISMTTVLRSLKSRRPFAVTLSPTLRSHSLPDIFEITPEYFDAIIVDRQAGISVGEASAVKEYAAKLVVVDYAAGELLPSADLIILPNLHAADHILQSPWWKNNPQKCLAGPEYVVLREAFYEARSATLQHGSGKTEVLHSESNDYLLLSVGGTDPYGLLEPMVERLFNIWQGEIVILSGAIPNDRLARHAANPRIRLVRPDADYEMVELMDKATLVVTVFGTVCYEALTRAIPMIVLPHGESDRAAAINFCERSQLAVYVESPDLLDEKTMQAIQNRKPKSRSAEQHRSAQAIFDLLNSPTSS